MERLSDDLLADITARIDGFGLASLACTSSHLRDIAREQSLWKNVCHSMWPSTSLPEAEHVISSPPAGGFHNFYACSRPLLVFHPNYSNNSVLKSPASPSDFVSLVDVFYRSKCVLSKFLDGIPEAVDVMGSKSPESSWDTACHQWFLNYPFKLQVFDTKHDCEEDDDAERDYERVSQPEDWKDLCRELIEDVRLSWVLVDKKAGKAVNLSSWKPVSVQRGWPYHGEYVMQFGCALAVNGEEAVLPEKSAKCTITARLKVVEGDLCPQWREISMRMESITGAHLNGRTSVMILNQALYSPRSTNQVKVEKGFQLYQKQKREMMRKHEFKQKLADTLYLFTQIALFVILYCALYL